MTLVDLCRPLHVFDAAKLRVDLGSSAWLDVFGAQLVEGATTNFADVLDLWEVALDANANQISLGGKSVPQSLRTLRCTACLV